jgi:hypothetical protein
MWSWLLAGRAERLGGGGGCWRGSAGGRGHTGHWRWCLAVLSESWTSGAGGGRSGVATRERASRAKQGRVGEQGRGDGLGAAARWRGGLVRSEEGRGLAACGGLAEAAAMRRAGAWHCGDRSEVRKLG